jgi:hypothetical protein
MRVSKVDYGFEGVSKRKEAGSMRLIGKCEMLFIFG